MTDPIPADRLAELRRIAAYQENCNPNPEDLAALIGEIDRLTAENRLLHAIQGIPTGSCPRTAIHPPHRWLSSRTTQHCPGRALDSAPRLDRPQVTCEFSFERMDRPRPMMVGVPGEAEARALMADFVDMHPGVPYVLLRRLVGPWEMVADEHATVAPEVEGIATADVEAQIAADAHDYCPDCGLPETNCTCG